MKTFIETLMDAITETSMSSMAETERILQPILSVFLPDVLSEMFKGDAEFSGPVKLISPKFPVKKTDDIQSSNLSWLMINPNRKQLLFVAFKMTDSRIIDKQIQIYKFAQERVAIESSGAFLVDDLKLMKENTPEPARIRFLLDQKLPTFETDIAACDQIKIIYLVPESLKHRTQGIVDKTLSFGELASSFPDAYTEEWNIIHQYLCEAENFSTEKLNQMVFDRSPKQDIHSTPTTTGQNYRKIYNFDSIIDLCKQRGDDILVAFMGGIEEFGKRDIDSLRERAYKWDEFNHPIGKKESRNWIPGTTFLKITNEKLLNQQSTAEKKVKASQKNQLSWQGTLKFHEMVQFCLDQGDNILIEFTGGKEAFSRSSILGLKMRLLYKWDYAENQAGKNLSNWLPGTLIIDMLKDVYGYAVNQES